MPVLEEVRSIDICFDFERNMMYAKSMKEVPIEWSDKLKLVRKWQKDFAITYGNETIELSRGIGRRVWLAMFSQWKFNDLVNWERRFRYAGPNTPIIPEYFDFYDLKSIPKELLKFYNFCRTSNCHGTAVEVLTQTGPIIMADWWSSISRDVSDAFLFVSIEKSLSAIMESHGFPLVLRNYDHTVIILGRINQDQSCVVFEKVGYNNRPFRLSLQKIDYLESEFLSVGIPIKEWG